MYIVVSPPLLLGLAAWIVSILKGAPYIFHVQDLQPDAAVALGMVNSGTFTRALYWLESVRVFRCRQDFRYQRGYD